MNVEVSSIEEAALILRAQNLVGLAPRPVDLLPLLRMGCLSQVWSCEAADAGWDEKFGARFFSLEAQLGHRERWRTADLDGLLPDLGERAASTPTGGKHTLIPYGLTDPWRSALNGLRERFVVPQALMGRPRVELASKIAMRRWLQDLGVPLPPSIVVARAFLDYGSVAKQLGAVFVLQTPIGSAGVGTYLIQGSADVDLAKRRQPATGQWLASAYAGDTTLNLHGLVTGRGAVAVSRPSVQLANLPRAGAGFGEYCGSDFCGPNGQPESVLRRCRLLVERIGTSLAGHGYQGVFGVDFAVCDEAVAVLEVNSRIQASTWLLSEIELSAGELPILCRHVLEAQGRSTAGEYEDSPTSGAHIVIRHTEAEGQLVSAPRVGVYAWRGAQLTWCRQGIGLLDCGIDEVVVTDVPPPGVLLRPGAALGRLVTRMSLVGPNGRCLSLEGMRLIEDFRRMCTVAPYSDLDR